MLAWLISSVPVWAPLMAFAVALTTASAWVGNAWATRSGAIISLAYVAMQIKKYIFSDNYLAYIASATVWVVAAGAISRQLADSERRILTPSARVRLLLVASGLCYLWARIVNAPPEFGSPPYTTADVLAFAAMSIIWWQIKDGLRSRIVDMVDDLGNWRSGLRGRPASFCVPQDCEENNGEVSPGKVRLHG